jgi:hypothetical protein
MAARFRIHPAIGIARLGNSPDKFYIAADQGGQLPIQCDDAGYPIIDKDGHEVRITRFKDEAGRIMRQAARFRVFVYDDRAPDGREVLIGDEFDIVAPRTGQLLTVRIDDIKWTVYLANKKSSWYKFEETNGEHGYDSDHPLRNADITNTEERQRLIIDPGPRSVRHKSEAAQRAIFDDQKGGVTSFPPELAPNSIHTLGELRCTQSANTNRLLVLGGFGNSGSMLDGFGNPKIEAYANNDGWFDDTADGPVSAQFAFTLLRIDGHPAPAGARASALTPIDPAWVIVGYPRYVPETLDIVTMDDLLFDIAVRDFGYVPYLYGVPPFDGAPKPPQDATDLELWRGLAQWNPAFRPYFRRDIWPILSRPLDAQQFMDADPLTGGNPHNNAPGGNFDIADLSMPPYQGEPPADRQRRHDKRQFLYGVLRKPGQENDLYPQPAPAGPGKRLYAMPLLCGDNPLSNTAPAKFFRLTDTMLFMLRQWAAGLFIDEQAEGIDPGLLPPGRGNALDRGALAAGLGGSFCPGAEASWIMRNPAIYVAPYRFRHAQATPGALSQPAGVPGDPPATTASLEAGLEPGDLTKYSAVPWQSDFNECTNQSIDVTYRDWNSITPDGSGDPVKSSSHLTYWWPMHRPVNLVAFGTLWSPTPQNNAGDLEMVTAWASLRFLIRDQENGGFKFAESDAPSS